MEKAQSAMEYLITYSWAILIIGITLSALYALGLFNPDSFISNQCIFPADFGCLSAFLYTNGSITVNLEQATQSSINVTSFGCNSGGTTTNMTPYIGANEIFMPVGSNITLTANCFSNGTIYTSNPGNLYNGHVVVNYTDLQTGFQHVLVGKIIEKSQ
ncbi:MAG: hypothetical protein ACREBH_04430 [Candidatus Micrarchaeaceae archaeon]